MGERAGLANDGAETVTIATLQTLGTRVSAGQLEDVADELPDELAGVLSTLEGVVGEGREGVCA